MAFSLDRDVKETIIVPLEYAYIFQTDKDGNVILDKETEEPLLQKFQFELSRERAADLDAEDAKRAVKLSAGEADHSPSSNVEMLFRLTRSMKGFDDFPAFTGDAVTTNPDYREKFIGYFSKDKAKQFVNDALIFHQRIVYPTDFFRGVPRRGVAGDLSRAAGSTSGQ